MVDTKEMRAGMIGTTANQNQFGRNTVLLLCDILDELRALRLENKHPLIVGCPDCQMPHGRHADSCPNAPRTPCPSCGSENQYHFGGCPSAGQLFVPCDMCGFTLGHDLACSRHPTVGLGRTVTRCEQCRGVNGYHQASCSVSVVGV